MADLVVLIVVAALAIALGLWLFANLGLVVAIVILWRSPGSVDG
jgi:hypothetical protein